MRWLLGLVWATGLLLVLHGEARAQSNESTDSYDFADDSLADGDARTGQGRSTTPPIGLPVRRHLYIELLRTDRALPE